MKTSSIIRSFGEVVFHAAIFTAILWLCYTLAVAPTFHLPPINFWRAFGITLAPRAIVCYLTSDYAKL